MKQTEPTWIEVSPVTRWWFANKKMLIDGLHMTNAVNTITNIEQATQVYRKNLRFEDLGFFFRIWNVSLGIFLYMDGHSCGDFRGYSTQAAGT